MWQRCRVSYITNSGVVGCGEGIVVVGHRLEIIIDHRLASVAAADAIFRL